MHRMVKIRLVFLVSGLLIAATSSPVVLAIGQKAYVDFAPGEDGFCLAQGDRLAMLCVDANAHTGVVRAVKDLQADIACVTGRTPELTHEPADLGTNVVLVGTIGKSAIIERLIRDGKIDVSQIIGKWESFLIQVVPEPIPGVAHGLVIAGSDKRGTIFGLYDLSEQIGVSPWYWWGDVPVARREALFVRPGTYVEGPPAVQYRGIFLNDEAPALSGWVHGKFGNYNHQFYTKVFELILRMKGNFLWPAMWDNSFNTDDPLNPKLADEYGIVMSTSHHEPMMRAWKEWERLGNKRGSWDYSQNAEALRAFWTEGIERTKDYEKIITLAMRGDGDEPMSQEANIALLEKIVADQRRIIAEKINPDLSAVPQVWALYKEVQGYYERGMRVPDDVILLWCDDNWGNLRRLPTAQERQRAGGAGIYYHFDYVGGPRNYKWLNTVPITKVWEQMNLAWQYDANRIWVVNVGDLKPMEFPIEFFLTLAWDPSRWPKERIAEYTRSWAQREFGPAHAAEIADIVARYTKYNGRRKPELIDPTTFNLVDYHEADRVLAEWRAVTTQAETIYAKLPENARDAFYQLVLHPTKASAIVTELYITAGRNRLYAEQKRAATTTWPRESGPCSSRTRPVPLLQPGDGRRQMEPHDGPDAHRLHQLAAASSETHAGGQGNRRARAGPDGRRGRRLDVRMARRFRCPSASDVRCVQPAATLYRRIQSRAGAFRVHRLCHRPLDCAQRHARNDRKGAAAVGEHRLGQGPRRIGLRDGDNRSRRRRNSHSRGGVVPSRRAGAGFPRSVRRGRRLRLHRGRALQRKGRRRDGPLGEDRGLWADRLIHDGLLPASASVDPPDGSPRLEYRMYLFRSGPVEVISTIAPTLNFVPGRGLRFAVSFDDEAPQVVTAVPEGFNADNGNRNWEASVRDNCRRLKSTHTIESPGYHTLKVWMVDPAVVLQKIVIDTGGLRPSYLARRKAIAASDPDRSRRFERETPFGLRCADERERAAEDCAFEDESAGWGGE